MLLTAPPPNHLASLISVASPDHAVVLATVGLCLIFLEFNRPGRVLPGMLGLTLLLLAVASLGHHPLRTAAVLLLVLTSALLATNLWRPLSLWISAPLTVALAISVRLLIPNTVNPHISTPFALTCGLTVGLLGTALSRIALRARRLKAVH